MLNAPIIWLQRKILLQTILTVHKLVYKHVLCVHVVLNALVQTHLINTCNFFFSNANQIVPSNFNTIQLTHIISNSREPGKQFELPVLQDNKMWGHGGWFSFEPISFSLNVCHVLIYSICAYFCICYTHFCHLKINIFTVGPGGYHASEHWIFNTSQTCRSNYGHEI